MIFYLLNVSIKVDVSAAFAYVSAPKDEAELDLIKVIDMFLSVLNLTDLSHSLPPQ